MSKEKKETKVEVPVTVFIDGEQTSPVSFINMVLNEFAEESKERYILNKFKCLSGEEGIELKLDWIRCSRKN